ncbi:MAG: SDR family NAD(P)-dependent oxidoreductase, partial [Acidobacteria bacterium]|nr:SDR family NAD(P)-dependent oxidoreductase [Acidobacteriota bacterium]
AFSNGPSQVSYAATKAWMNSFTEGLHLELRAAGSPVRVQALCPGLTHTEFHDALGADVSAIPERFWMSAEDVVTASLEGLARGKLIVIPGGWNRLFYFFLKVLPRSVLHPMQIRFSSMNRKPRRQ